MRSDPQDQIGACNGTHPSELRARSSIDLPSGSASARWIPRRKATVVAGIRAGLLSVEEACSRYGLTLEEYLSWEVAVDQHGLQGLRTTKVQQYRKPRPFRRA